MTKLTFEEKKLAVVENLAELRMIDAPFAEKAMYEVRAGVYDRVIGELDINELNEQNLKLLTDVILEMEAM